MNEQIKKLGSKAMSEVMNGSDPYGDADRMYIPAEFMEKFAELIVEECMDVVIDCDENPKMILHDPYRTIIDRISEHFGVEA